MSNRTLLELNHDRAAALARNPEQFLCAISNYLGSCDPVAAEMLRLHYDVTVFRTQHHSDTSRLTWSGGTADFEECPHG